MTILNLKDFVKKYKIKIIIINESQLHRVYNYPMYPRDIKVYSYEGFVNIDNGSMNGTHWIALY